MVAGILLFYLLGPVCQSENLPEDLTPWFQPSGQYAKPAIRHRSPLLFEDGRPVRTPEEWARRKAEIRAHWHGLMGQWPPILERPKVERLDTQTIDGIPVTRLRLETAPGRLVEDAYLLKPASGQGPFPAVVVVYHEAGTAIGKPPGEAEKGAFRDYAIQLARRGFVTLSLGGDPNTYYPDKDRCRIQPLSFHAYEAANIAHLPP
jgi:hypothetical protein